MDRVNHKLRFRFKAKPRVKNSPLKRKLAALSPRRGRKAGTLINHVPTPITHIPTPLTNIPPPWPEHATLVYGNGTEVPLRRQHLLIRRVARTAIETVTKTLVLERAWEEDVSERDGYGAKVLKDACRALVAKYPDVGDIYKRLKEDEVFTAHFKSIPVDRLSSLRAPAKNEADVFISYFKLGLGDECKARVEALFVKHIYVFPGHWEGPGSLTWAPDLKKAYGNPVLAHILKAGFFRTPTSTGSAHAGSFPEHDGKREVPKSLLALAATGIYASLYQAQHGTGAKKERFHGNSFATTYNAHLQTLEKMEQKTPSLFHRIMAGLYVEVCGKEEVSGNDDIFSVLDLDDS
ncbi:hypothetical protein NMY22_g10788 [Coprinellus aureogranulatus]|nr:hypothetical protein NMY22_g10788 [Coprinellus aureogranulatus]